MRNTRRVKPLSGPPKETNERTEMGDTSFMDTEPLDMSVFDTEPMDVDGLMRTRAGDDVSETGSETQSSVIGFDISGVSASPSIVDDESESDSHTIDISMAASHEVKRIYSDLIDSCRGFMEDTLSDDSEKILKENITVGEALFKQMEESLSNSLSENQDGSKNVAYRANSVSELYLACQHTKVCSTMLKQAVKNIGGGPCAFKLEDFTDYLKRASVNENGTYSVLTAVRKLAVTANNVFYTAPGFYSVSGCIDKSAMLQPKKPPDQIEPKVRITRKKEKVEEEESTQKEVINEKVDAAQTENHKENASEAVAKDVLKAVKSKYRSENTPQGMLEVIYANDVSQVVSRLFGVAFVVRDGLVGVDCDDHGATVDASLALTLKPEKPPEKNEHTEHSNNDRGRKQYIASFSAKLLKELIKSGKGS